MKLRWLGILLLLLALLLSALVIARARVYEEKTKYLIGGKGWGVKISDIEGNKGIGTFNVSLTPKSKIGYQVYVGVTNTTVIYGALDLWVIDPYEGITLLEKFIESNTPPPGWPPRVYAVKYNITSTEFRLGDPDPLDYDGPYTFAFIYRAPSEFDVAEVELNVMERWLEPVPWAPSIIDESMIGSATVLTIVGLYLAWKNPSLPREKQKIKVKHRKH
jgi:hypothetical protein